MLLSAAADGDDVPSRSLWHIAVVVVVPRRLPAGYVQLHHLPNVVMVAITCSLPDTGL
jgi:hypothetical protein